MDEQLIALWHTFGIWPLPKVTNLLRLVGTISDFWGVPADMMVAVPLG